MLPNNLLQLQCNEYTNFKISINLNSVENNSRREAETIFIRIILRTADFPPQKCLEFNFSFNDIFFSNSQHLLEHQHTIL